MQSKPCKSNPEDRGPDSDVVMSCRVRLARNLAGFPFVNSSSKQQQVELIRVLKNVLINDSMGEKLVWVDLNESTNRERLLLVERHLISKQHAESDACRAVALSRDESLSVMVNEEDHLRMQALAPGLQLEEVLSRINAFDDAIEQHLDYAFDSRWGYLTACPTNVGTGARFSVMLHLPALKITNEVERVRRAAKELQLAVRGYYGEGSESAGDFYQVSNQITLGKTEAELLSEFCDRIVPKVIEYERHARRLLLEHNLAHLDDRVHRALGTLRMARLMGVEEAMRLLSRLRLGVTLGRIEGISLATINRLFLEVQPSHLQVQAGPGSAGNELRQARATLLRDALKC